MTMTTNTPLNEAAYIYANRASFSRERLIEAAGELAEHGVFSGRGISRITGLSPRQVLRAAPKQTKTGNKFDPEVLAELVALSESRARGEMNVFLAKEVLGKCSADLAARLTGIPRSTLLRWAARADSL